MAKVVTLHVMAWLKDGTAQEDLLHQPHYVLQFVEMGLL